MGKRKSRKEEIDSDLEFYNNIEDGYMSNHEEDKYAQKNDSGDDDDCEDEVDDDERDSEKEGDEGSSESDGNEQEGGEMEELEKEYKELKNQEQNLLKNLKHHKDEDVEKGRAVKSQRALWDKTLELRFLLQKPFSSCNRLPQESVRSLFSETESGVSEAYEDLIASSKKTLDAILELQQALVENNPSVAQAIEANNMKDSKQLPSGDFDEEWLQISQMQSRMSSFVNKAIDKWQRKTQVTTGAAAIKDKLHAFNQSISQQVSTYMRDPSKMIKGMQQNRSVVAVFGNVPDATDNIKDEANANGDPELLDDSDFYQQLLKEFFETIDPASSEMAFYALKRLQKKKRKIVDRRASKSRKIRYNVHEKIVNFTAPKPVNIPPMASILFENLFGSKSKKAAPVA
ncbi:hypothetical protein ACJIZ3_007694 [Penstemon smallii]|uniref:Uncharacterized protein n=1 Tax=Penstemon smallii TaxID=265156 RepID=A0ABD3T8N1_9LAMI